ncbi:hypothetical protein [Agrobacterium vitis]|uniref:hypothetical protein n=1 Tax=Agrobacterium vitis TaxID=373 RepID=UPI0008DBFC1E|nr:hypothetical protein [Agrobacterium vitis]MUO85555.1 hypothetical protein [Agrobacterium vitis]
MATEQEYDDIIAPMLADVARKAAELGMSLIARVEWDPGESGITQIGPMDQSIGQRMTQFAAHSHGNIDKMLLSMQRAGIDFSQSIILSHMMER